MQEITEITGNNRCLFCRHAGMIQITELTSGGHWPRRQMSRTVETRFLCKLSGRTITLDRAWNDFYCRAWEPATQQQQDKAPVDQAIDILRGYCEKVPRCSGCRFNTADVGCPFMQETPPCDWAMDERQQKGKEDTGNG